MAAKKSYKGKVKSLGRQIEAAIVKEIKALLANKRFARKPVKKTTRKKATKATTRKTARKPARKSARRIAKKV